MSKRITALPTEEVVIEFNDKEFLATFNMLAVGYMQEELTKPGSPKLSVVEFGVLVLYSGIKVNNPEFTIEEARAMALTMSPISLNEIIESYMESAGTENELVEEAKKKIIARMLLNISK